MIFPRQSHSAGASSASCVECAAGALYLLSTAEPACYSTPEESGLRVETLSFDRIPHQTRLFLDYVKDPVALREFYPSAVRFHHELSDRAEEVLQAYTTDRKVLSDALEEMNTGWG